MPGSEASRGRSIRQDAARSRSGTTSGHSGAATSHVADFYTETTMSGQPDPDSEPAVAALGEVKQYLGVLRRQNIALAVKLARAERRIEELSLKVESLDCRAEP